MPLTPELKVIGCGESPVGHLLPPTWRNLTAAARRKGEQQMLELFLLAVHPK